MSEYGKLQDKYFEAQSQFWADVAALQSSCPHEELSGWLGEDRGEEVRMCLRCHKTVKTKWKES